MGTLPAGIILWALPHWFKRLLPNFRNSLGQTGRIGIALSVLVSVVLMIIGYRSAPVITVWYPPAFLIHFMKEQTGFRFI